MRLAIDSHLDLAWNALAWKRDITRPLAEINAAEADWRDSPARGRATVSLPEMRRGGFAVSLATLMARWAPPREELHSTIAWLNHRTPDIAHASARGQLAYYEALAARGEVVLIGDARRLREHWQRWQAAGAETAALPLGLIVAMEGCDGIVDPSQTEWWFALGLRVASLVHYGRSAYAVGTGEEGPLTPRGREMLAAFQRTGIVLDVTHLCDASFAEALDCYGGPLLASHNNCRALVPGQRQFADSQLRQIIRRDGVVGVACDNWMLAPGWKTGVTPRSAAPLSALADQIDHICQLAGNPRHAALGSDLDGGYGSEQSPEGLGSIADLQRVAEILADRGYSDAEIDGIFHGQWLRFFLEHLPKESANPS
jgi:membrane dipeptidase